MRKYLILSLLVSLNLKAQENKNKVIFVFDEEKDEVTFEGENAVLVLNGRHMEQVAL